MIEKGRNDDDDDSASCKILCSGLFLARSWWIWVVQA